MGEFLAQPGSADYIPAAMDILHAMALGIVEGLTEFVPVSSTGHLILTGHWLGLHADPTQKAAVDAFDIVIQAGAWLACVAWYTPLLRRRAMELRSSDADVLRRARHLWLGLGIAFVPVMAAGLLFRKTIKALFFGPIPVAIALATGGVAMIALHYILQRRPVGRPLDALTPRDAVVVGIAQCLALIPGTSRSMATIVAARLVGLDARAAADFSFLLAIPVLGAATAYELLKEWHVLVTGIGPAALAVGLVTAFVFGWGSIAGFLHILDRHGLAPFGVYRILLAGVVWLTLAS